jgi:hypothetical protein
MKNKTGKNTVKQDKNRHFAKLHETFCQTSHAVTTIVVARLNYTPSHD